MPTTTVGVLFVGDMTLVQQPWTVRFVWTEIESVGLAGIKDVKQMTAKQLFAHKLAVVVEHIDPPVLTQSFVGIYQGFMGVLTVLKFQFAKSVALGLSIGNALRKPLALFLTPTIAHILPPQHRQRWSPVIINYICKSVAVWVAFYLQRRISGIQCAIQVCHCRNDASSLENLTSRRFVIL